LSGRGSFILSVFSFFLGDRGGTLAKLAERLTYDKYVDTYYLQQFLLTYRSFTSPKNFLALLIERYNVPNPVRASPEQMKRFQVSLSASSILF